MTRTGEKKTYLGPFRSISCDKRSEIIKSWEAITETTLCLSPSRCRISYQSCPNDPMYTPVLEPLQLTSPASSSDSRATSSIIRCCGSSHSTSIRDMENMDVSSPARSTDSSRKYPYSVLVVPARFVAE